MLQLEYICTDAEMREAQSLNLRRQLGKGSRARTLLMLFGFLAVLLTLAYFQIRETVAPKYQPWFLLFVAVMFVIFYFRQARPRKRPAKPAKIELSDREVTIINDGLRVSTLWPGFSQCLESPNLFVLLDRPKGLMLIFPKRAFPNERAQNWFRIQANQLPSVAASTAEVPMSQGVSVSADGITLKFQHGYLDYLNRTMTSWRARGLVVGVYVVITLICLYSAAYPPTQAVNSTTKVYFVFMLPFTTAMLAVILPLVTFLAWRTDKNYLVMRHVVLSNGGITFADQDGNGFMPWSAYKYWLENRWCFLVWKPGGRLWDLYPKRAFTSASEMGRCRALLQQNLQCSRWFSCN